MAKPQEKELIAPISKDLLSKELNEDRFIRKTNYGGNEIYVVTHHDSPNVMKEIGRLRELSFRLAGGGTGKEADIDSYDIAENAYYQLIVWEPQEKEIIGGYRFHNCNNVPTDDAGNIKIGTTGLFNLSEKFKKEYLPWSLELGRSFVRPEYQARNSGRKAVFALDNLWDGLGAITIETPSIKYFFGKITMYVHFDTLARDLILYFFSKYFKDKEGLMSPIVEEGLKTDIEILESAFTGGSYEKDYKILSKKVRDRDENIPPLFNSYMNISPNMRVFGTAINHNFGGVEETGIMITVNDIYESKKHRHLSSYKARGLKF